MEKILDYLESKIDKVTEQQENNHQQLLTMLQEELPKNLHDKTAKNFEVNGALAVTKDGRIQAALLRAAQQHHPRTYRH